MSRIEIAVDLTHEGKAAVRLSAADMPTREAALLLLATIIKTVETVAKDIDLRNSENGAFLQDLEQKVIVEPDVEFSTRRLVIPKRNHDGQ